jgi:hypothetical protein
LRSWHGSVWSFRYPMVWGATVLWCRWRIG